MKNIINEFKADHSVAFAHAISKDAYMNAGVALVFRYAFGRPTPEDFVDPLLSCQNSNKGAPVFGLVTKAKYYEKPTKQSYDEAFRVFLNHFRKEKCTTLICSSIGCSRDEVPIADFIHNIAYFQQETGAAIKIVTFDEGPKKKLRKGLSYQDFLKQLCAEIGKHQPYTTTKSPNPLPDVISPTSTQLIRGLSHEDFPINIQHLLNNNTQQLQSSSSTNMDKTLCTPISQNPEESPPLNETTCSTTQRISDISSSESKLLQDSLNCSDFVGFCDESILNSANNVLACLTDSNLCLEGKDVSMANNLN